MELVLDIEAHAGKALLAPGDQRLCGVTLPLCIKGQVVKQALDRLQASPHVDGHSPPRKLGVEGEVPPSLGDLLVRGAHGATVLCGSGSSALPGEEVGGALLIAVEPAPGAPTKGPARLLLTNRPGHGTAAPRQALAPPPALAAAMAPAAPVGAGSPRVDAPPFLGRLHNSGRDPGGIFALRAHCALLLDYDPPEEPPSTPLGNALRIR